MSRVNHCLGVAGKYKNFSKKILLSVLAISLILFSLGTRAAFTFNVPTSDVDGTYTLSWSGTGIYVILSEQVSGSSTWTQIARGTITSKTITGKGPGTYHYNLANYCQIELHPALGRLDLKIFPSYHKCGHIVFLGYSG